MRIFRVNWKCMSGMARMNTILRSYQTRQLLSRHIVPSAEERSFYLKADIPCFAGCTDVMIVRRPKKSGNKLFVNITGSVKRNDFLKIMRKKSRQPTPKDFERMWGEDGPYSQVRLCEEVRILDDGISRIFLVVEAEINPFTFEYVRAHRQEFAGDESILRILDHAEYRGDKFGYVVSAGEVEYADEAAKQFARTQADATIESVICMHAFVISQHGLGRDDRFGVIDDRTVDGRQLVWNKQTGQMEWRDDELWDNQTLIESPAGVRHNKTRFFTVLPFAKDFDFKKASATILATTLKKVSARFKVEIEEVGSFQEYVFLAALLPFDIAPARFMETVLAKCNAAAKKRIFQKDYLITNVKKPTPAQIMSFLQQLPLDRDIEME